MKSFVFLLALVGMIITPEVNGQIPQPPNTLDIRVQKVSSGTIVVGIHNNAEKTIRIWNESNSWGAAHWRILIIKDGQVITLFQNPNLLFTKNSPGYHEVGKDGIYQQTLDVNDGYWCGLDGEKISFQTGDTVIVQYDVPPTKEGYKLDVWYGVAAAITLIK